MVPSKEFLPSGTLIFPLAVTVKVPVALINLPVPFVIVEDKIAWILPSASGILEYPLKELNNRRIYCRKQKNQKKETVAIVGEKAFALK